MALFNWRFGKAAVDAPTGDVFQEYCNGRSAEVLRQALSQYKRLRQRIRQGNIKYLGRICSEVGAECAFVTRASTTWRYGRKSASPLGHPYPMSHWENDDIGRWEGTNWFYRTHLLNHVINCLEDYMEKNSVRLG